MKSGHGGKVSGCVGLLALAGIYVRIYVPPLYWEATDQKRPRPFPEPPLADREAAFLLSQAGVGACRREG